MTQQNRKSGPSISKRDGQSSRIRKNSATASYQGQLPNMKNPVVNMAGAGVLRVPGIRDAGRYRDRLRENEGKKYPNRRRRIITGKDLTTPLTRKKTIERVRRKRAKAKTAAKKTASIEVQTVAVKANKFPVNALFAFFVFSVFLFGLILSQIVLNEQNTEINRWVDKINTENKKEKNLKNELENKNDLSFIIDYAVNELDMVKEESNSIKKTYISGKSGDRAEVVEAQGGPFVDLPDVMSAIFK